MYKDSKGNRIPDGGCRVKTGRKAAGQFLLWLGLGAAAGIFLAAVLSVHEYRELADITGSVMQSESLMEGIKNSSGEFREVGEYILKDYGYRPLGSWGKNLPYTMAVSIFLFQAAGWISFGWQYAEELKKKKRIQGLTEYLKLINSGDAVALCRCEDEFSHLEDEIYKTVMELLGTKETAVKNHEVLSERIAGIAHQLKTPLTSMSLMTELLEEYQTSDTKEYYTRLSNQIQRLKNLVSGLLSLAKLDSHEIIFNEERLELSELLEAAAEPLKGMMDERGISLKTEDAMEMSCYIYADRQWTEEALLNILKNCVEHTPAGGRITVSCSQNPIYTELEIEDGGNGFAKKDLPHIFERFYRGAGAAKDNAGIGLALSKEVLEQQNGHIHAENSADGHARFCIKWYRPLLQ